MNIDVYNQVKKSAGWRHIEQPGVMIITGKDRQDLLQRLTTNDITTLGQRDGLQTVLLTDKARIVDVVTIFEVNDAYMMLTSSGAQDAIATWFDKYIIMDDVTVEDVTFEYHAFHITGPQAADALEEFSGESVRDMLIATHRSTSMFDSDVIIVKQPTMCELSYLVVANLENAEHLHPVFSSMIETFPEFGDEEYQALRIEAGLGELGAEWGEKFNPLEAGLIGLVDFEKGCYIGQEVIARLDTYNKVKQRLVGFTSIEEIPVGATFTTDSKRAGGEITSSTFSPELNMYIALGYLRNELANPGATITTEHDGAKYTFTIQKLPLTM